MKLRIMTGLLAVAVCVLLATNPTYGSQDNVGTPITKVSKETSTAAPAAPAGGGFRDPLDTPPLRSRLASKTTLCAVACAGKRVVALGIRGIIIYSDDGGKSWIQATVPVSVDLTGLYFPTPQKGWAVGHDGVVLHTTDAGATWVKQLDGREVCRIMEKYYLENPLCGQPDSAVAEKLLADIQFTIKQGPVNPFLDVWFENESSGFVVGAFNLIFRTTDGGKTWTPWFDRTENPNGLHFCSIRPSGEDVYLSGEQGMMWKLDQASGRFKAMQTPYTGTLFGIVGKPGLVLTFGQRGNLYRSQNGGTSWQKIESGVSATIFGSTVMEDGRIVLVTQAGNVIVSKDDGLSFTEIKTETAGVPKFAVAAMDKKTLAVASMIGMLIQSIE
ncbi:MAG: WD40/YVTN/BNR-like repeat-containing protein [Syntrophobacteraceae bacterium]